VYGDIVMKRFSRKKGLTLIELITAIVIAAIVMMAIVALYINTDHSFKKNKQISDLLQNSQAAIFNLNYLFSRWGVGVPCYNNTCVYSSNSIPACGGFPPTDPLCMDCKVGSLNSTTGCSDIVFYANLKGLGFVVSVNGTQASVISCRLTARANDNYYYVWNNGTVLMNSTSGLPIVYKINKIDPDDADCVDNASVNAVMDAVLNSTAGNYKVAPGDVLIRVPKKIELYIDENELKEHIWDMYDPLNPQDEGVKVLANVKSFKVFQNGRGVKVIIEFFNPENPALSFKVERYYAR